MTRWRGKFRLDKHLCALSAFPFTHPQVSPVWRSETVPCGAPRAFIFGCCAPGLHVPVVPVDVDRYRYSLVRYDLTRSNLAKAVVKFAKNLLTLTRSNFANKVFTLAINSPVGSRASSSRVSTCMGAAPPSPIPTETRENVVTCQLLTCGQINFLKKGGFPVRISTEVPATMPVPGRTGTYLIYDTH